MFCVIGPSCRTPSFDLHHGGHHGDAPAIDRAAATIAIHMPPHFHIEGRRFRAAGRRCNGMGAAQHSRITGRMAHDESARMSMQRGTPNIQAVRADKGRRLLVVWKGGAESPIDISQHISTYAIFAPLLGTAGCSGMSWLANGAGACAGPGGMEYRRIRYGDSRSIRVRPGCAKWRTAHGMTQAEAAHALGVSPRMWRYYEAGEHLLPKTVRLAALATTLWRQPPKPAT